MGSAMVTDEMGWPPEIGGWGRKEGRKSIAGNREIERVDCRRVRASCADTIVSIIVR
jgi:hypothetical protein